MCIPTGWWFVQLEIGSKEGWAPGAFLEPLVSMPQSKEHSIYDGQFCWYLINKIDDKE